MQMNGSEILVHSLIDQGVDLVFGYPGGTVLFIYDALYHHQDKITHILASHEQGAAHAADGYARATGKTGVAIATSGPGATNLITGIANAFLDSTPTVFITGNVALDQIGRSSFQEVDAVGITRPIIKKNFFVKDPGEIARVVREAFTVANSGRKGPVHIDIPKDVTAAMAEFVPEPRFTVLPEPELAEDAIAAAADLIRNAERPLLYVGGGVVFADASAALRAFLEKTKLPVCNSMMGSSAVLPSYSLNLGMVGMHGTPTANMATGECDLLVAVGARFSDRVTGKRNAFAQNSKVIHIDIDPAEISKNIPADVGIVGQSATVLQRLADLLPPGKSSPWTHKLLRYKAMNPLPASNSPSLTPYKVLTALKKIMADDAIIATDVGQHQMFTAQHYPFSVPRTFISSCGLGTMGFGMGAAVGAQVGCPDKRVVLITGDGCFHMNLPEFAVAVTHNLPVVVLIMNNGILGMVHQWQNLFYDKRYASTLLHRNTDFVKLAEAFGGVGMRVTEEGNLKETLQAALDCGKPCIVDCVVDPGERVFPIIPPGGTDKDIIYCD